MVARYAQGHRFKKVNWLYFIVLMWMATISYSSISNYHKEKTTVIPVFYCIPGGSTDE